METFDNKSHWENIYAHKSLQEVSWYEEIPHFSLNLIKKFSTEKNEAFIDIGGGDSYLVEFLLKDEFQDLSVLDISENVITRAKTRLGEKSNHVNWINSDILEFKSDKKYALWHDRAAFHFLTTKEEQEKYVQIAFENIKTDGKLILGTFSKNGPTKCSGIPIQQYDESAIKSLFEPYFELIESMSYNHPTPFNTEQEFLFCILHKK